MEPETGYFLCVTESLTFSPCNDFSMAGGSALNQMIQLVMKAKVPANNTLPEAPVKKSEV